VGVCDPNLQTKRFPSLLPEPKIDTPSKTSKKKKEKDFEKGFKFLVNKKAK